jgi:phenylpropionate dioxygenase-like ring-hydroxylating dioxygenase large terminal subunit
VLSLEENRLLTETDPGTPMGELFRRFWLPAMLSAELPGADCPPVRLRLLGENLAGFRDTNGQVGVLDAYCPHRGAPLFFGRNEECGLRCVYHGWKFDVHGTCVDIPNVPEGATYKQKIRTIAYPTIEKAGLIWVYMGPADKQPPFHRFEWLDTPDSHRFIQKLVIHCNYFQSMEGDFDASHAPFLHRTLDNNASNLHLRIRESAGSMEDMMPRYVLEDTPYGNIFGAVRKQQDDNNYVSVTHWILPCFTTPGASPKVLQMNFRVPVDDEHTMHYRLRYDLNDPLSERELWENKHGGFLFPEVIPGTFTPVANKSNDYLIDRLMQRNYSYTGIKSFPIQDLAMIEDQWGPIANRSLEHLVSSDEAIIRVRRNILKAARDLSKGIEPTLAWTPEVARVLPTRMVLPADADVAAALQPHWQARP